MPKYLNLQINEPCHQDWYVMTPNEQGRYCGSCAKTVVDFSGMTNTQILNYFNSNTGNTCGRFYDDQLEMPIAIPRKEIPWLKYFFTITLPAFLFSLKVSAQKKINVEKTELIQNKAVSDSFQNMKVETLKEVVVTGYGFSHGCTRRQTGGAISIFYTNETKSKKENTIIKKDSIQKQIATKILLFPNPVPPNSTLNLSFNKEMLGETVIEIFTANGNLVKKENKNFVSITKSTFINTNNLQLGFYICVATNILTNEKLSKEFLIK